MSGLIDLLTGGSLGAVFGGLQRVVETKMSNSLKKEEFKHIEAMQSLQFQHDLRMARQQLMVEEIKSIASHTQATFDHEVNFKPAQWVDNIRALIRPMLTVTVIWMAYIKPDEFLSLASAVILWWFSSRVSINGGNT